MAFGMGSAYLRKYWSPARLFSRKRGRNLDMTLLGGSGGIAGSKSGKDCISEFRKSSNSEYRFRMFM